MGDLTSCLGFLYKFI